jgi:hypothetical protein
LAELSQRDPLSSRPMKKLLLLLIVIALGAVAAKKLRSA